ncbi:UPF0182 family protein [Candidatus Woesearchaeota archaeon]|nr:UPF0182 family protein [Candidatus Woesearchaeota archaeon]
MASKNRLFVMIALLVFIVMVSISSLARLITDYFWFDALGFSKIFVINLEASLLMFFVSGIVYFIFFLLNLIISSRLKDNNSQNKLVSTKAKLLLSGVVAYLLASSTASSWMQLMIYLRQVPFGVSDPIFGMDAGFYVFSLPFLQMAWKFAFICMIITAIIVTLDYLQSFISGLFRNPSVRKDAEKDSEGMGSMPRYSVNLKQELLKLKKRAVVHISVLVSFLFILLALKHYLSRYSIMFSEKGIVVGAGYTDVVVWLPAVKILMFAAAAIAVIFFIWTVYISKAKMNKVRILAYAFLGYVLIALLGLGILPTIVQSLYVSPNEINLEKQYIDNNIRFTKIAYGLSDVTEEDFPFEKVTAVSDASGTIENIRILDWRPLTSTYKQTQEIRLYYDLAGVDIDRYNISGKYTQVILAARELEQDQITDNAKTWVNLHMVYTHGYGVVMSPVNRVTREGLPEYYVKDIPPVYTVDDENIMISRPEIYYGELDNDFVLVNTKTDEFNYPKGNTNEYINYDGSGGVVLDSFAKKLLFALRFADIKILLSSSINPDSRIMFNRNVQDRIRKVTPFLGLDSDPYLVIDDGRLYWIQDAYTTTGNFPYSQKHGKINYIRNSAKIVMDAYNGKLTYYMVGDDPIIRTYSKIYPGEFKDFSEMPEGLKKHIRYPEELFSVQSAIYSTYHMEDHVVFYNKEDAWDIPNEIYGTGQQVRVEPYYIIMKLPGEDDIEFVLMTSFTPIKKDNMVAWLAGRSDGSKYGKLLLYKFPKDKLVYGPSQIEAKIDQDSEISQQLTLWSQQGSRVTRGNLLVIPIDNSILYIEPLYIQSEKGQLPELKRVLASDGDRVVMEENLGLALESLFGKTQIPDKPDDLEEGLDQEDMDGITDDTNLVRRANDYYENILDAMTKGNWSGIGENMEELGKILEAMAGR